MDEKSENRENLTLEKARVVERLEQLEISVNTLITESRLRTENDRPILKVMQENIDKLSHAVNGNGKVGLSERMRNIEGMVSHIKWLWISVIAFSAGFVKDWIVNHK